jgi:ABC-2 type transport system permease protein
MASPDYVLHPGAGASGRRGSLAHQLRILRVIAGTEFKLKYTDSALGYVWSVAKPLALFSVLYVVFGRFFALGAGFEDYPIYLLIGIVLWTFFVDATMLTSTSIVARGSLLRKLVFPHLVIPTSMTMTSGITFLVNLLPLAGFIAWNRITPRVEWLLLLPLLLELFLFTLGAGLLLATLFVRFRDIGQLWELLTQLLFYASPIIIPVGFLPPWFQPIAFLNPFVQVMQDIRAVILPGTEVITAQTTLVSAGGRATPIAITIATLALGFYLFRRESPWFAERV